ncbi:hypothetical protein RYX36_018625 [Vicia faba]
MEMKTQKSGFGCGEQRVGDDIGNIVEIFVGEAVGSLIGEDNCDVAIFPVMIFSFPVTDLIFPIKMFYLLKMDLFSSEKSTKNLPEKLSKVLPLPDMTPEVFPEKTTELSHFTNDSSNVDILDLFLETLPLEKNMDVCKTIVLSLPTSIGTSQVIIDYTLDVSESIRKVAYESVSESVMEALLKAGLVKLNNGASIQQYILSNGDSTEGEAVRCPPSIILMEAEATLYWRIA